MTDDDALEIDTAAEAEAPEDLSETYHRLRRIAHQQLGRYRPGATLDTTAADLTRFAFTVDVRMLHHIRLYLSYLAWRLPSSTSLNSSVPIGLTICKSKSACRVRCLASS